MEPQLRAPAAPALLTALFIAVLAALNIAHELLALRQANVNERQSVAQHVQALKHKLEGVLSTSVK